MFQTSLLTCSVVALYLAIASTMGMQGQSFSINLCSIRDEIAKECFNSDIVIIEWLSCGPKELYKSGHTLECSPKFISEEEEAILILNKEGQSYNCNSKFFQHSISYPADIASYDVEYISCNWLSKQEQLIFTQFLGDGDSYHSTERRVQSSCSISLNLYSVSFI